MHVKIRIEIVEGTTETFFRKLLLPPTFSDEGGGGECRQPQLNNTVVCILTACSVTTIYGRSLNVVKQQAFVAAHYGHLGEV